ncbi:MAG TPA: hypothetical protein V6C81_29270 [Planktothrix sp.]|jgi:hypothetical protein
MFLITHFLAEFTTAAFVAAFSTLYLIWKFQTGGFFEAIITSKSNSGGGGLAEIITKFFAVAAYAGVSLVFIVAALGLYTLSAISLITIGIAGLTHGMVGQGLLALGVVAFTIVGVIVSYKTGIFSDKKNKKQQRS